MTEQPPSDWTSSASPEQAPAGPPITPLNRIGYALALSPKAFHGTLRPVDWAVALLLVVVVSVLVSIWTVDLIVEANLDQLESELANRESMSPEEEGQARSMAVNVMRAVSIGGAVVGVPLACLIAATVFLLIVNFGFAGSARFGALWAVACIAWAPKAIEMILIGLLRKMQGTAEISFSPAVLLPDDGSMLRKILGVFDLFDIWMIGIHIVGLGVVGTLTHGKHKTAVIIAWILYWVFSIGAVALGQRVRGM